MKIIKRDYVYTSDCVDADTVLRLLPSWIKYYNEEAPYLGLEMISPVENLLNSRFLNDPLKCATFAVIFE